MRYPRLPEGNGLELPNSLHLSLQAWSCYSKIVVMSHCRIEQSDLGSLGKPNKKNARRGIVKSCTGYRITIIAPVKGNIPSTILTLSLCSLLPQNGPSQHHHQCAQACPAYRPRVTPTPVSRTLLRCQFNNRRILTIRNDCLGYHICRA